jgi:ATP-dependent protease ClpP protease subunit
MHATPERTIRIWGDDIESELTHIIVSQMETLLNSMENPDWVTLEIFSRGGDVVAGRALYDWLRVNVPALQTVAYGNVNSMAVVLFLAGKHRVVTPGSTFLLHAASAYHDKPISFTTAEYMANAKSLRVIEKRYSNILLERMEKPPSKSELKKLLENETEIEARQALKWGLAHELWSPS